MAEEKKPWDPSQLRKYDLVLDQIPRLHYLDPKVDELIAESVSITSSHVRHKFPKLTLIFFLQKPVVITDSNLVASARKWTLEYLEQNLGNGNYTVYVSRNHKFKYFDEKKVAGLNGNSKGVDFVPPTKMVSMKLPEFIKRLREWKRGDERYVFVFSS